MQISQQELCDLLLTSRPGNVKCYRHQQLLKQILIQKRPPTMFEYILGGLKVRYMWGGLSVIVGVFLLVVVNQPTSASEHFPQELQLLVSDWEETDINEVSFVSPREYRQLIEEIQTGKDWNYIPYQKPRNNMSNVMVSGQGGYLGLPNLVSESEYGWLEFVNQEGKYVTVVLNKDNLPVLRVER